MVNAPTAPSRHVTVPALRRLRSRLALPAAAATAVAGAAHVPVTPQHLHEVPYVGGMFVALIAVCALTAILLAVRDTALVWWTVAVSCLAAVVLYVVSRGPGMPGMSDDIGDWTNRLGVISVLSESLVVILAGAALWRADALPTRTRCVLVTALPAAALLVTAAGYLTGVIAV